jgi:hypothetical protein
LEIRPPLHSLPDRPVNWCSPWQFQARGIDFVSVTQAIDTSGPMGKLVFSVLAAVAEFERELVRERNVLRDDDLSKKLGAMEICRSLVPSGHLVHPPAQVTPCGELD